MTASSNVGCTSAIGLLSLPVLQEWLASVISKNGVQRTGINPFLTP